MKRMQRRWIDVFCTQLFIDSRNLVRISTHDTESKESDENFAGSFLICSLCKLWNGNREIRSMCRAKSLRSRAARRCVCSGTVCSLEYHGVQIESSSGPYWAKVEDGGSCSGISLQNRSCTWTNHRQSSKGIGLFLSWNVNRYIKSWGVPVKIERTVERNPSRPKSFVVQFFGPFLSV